MSATKSYRFLYISLRDFLFRLDLLMSVAPDLGLGKAASVDAVLDISYFL